MLSLPIALRPLLAAQPQLVAPVLQVVQWVVTRHLLDRAGLKADEGHHGAVALIQRFGSAANLNIHLHCLMLDGVCRCGGDGVPSFVEVDAPNDDELHALLQTLTTRLMQLLARRGVLVEEMGQTCLAEPDADGDEARTLRPLQAAALAKHKQSTGLVVSGLGQSHRLRPARRAQGADPAWCPAARVAAEPAPVRRRRRLQPARGGRCEEHDRKRLEQLCRYITRPALSDEQVQCHAAGQVELKLKMPWRDGTTHLVMSPLEFM